MGILQAFWRSFHENHNKYKINNIWTLWLDQKAIFAKTRDNFPDKRLIMTLNLSSLFRMPSQVNYELVIGQPKKWKQNLFKKYSLISMLSLHWRVHKNWSNNVLMPLKTEKALKIEQTHENSSNFLCTFSRIFFLFWIITLI